MQFLKDRREAGNHAAQASLKLIIARVFQCRDYTFVREQKCRTSIENFVLPKQ